MSTAEKGEDCAFVECCAEKLKRDLKLKGSSHSAAGRQSKDEDVTANGSKAVVSLVNGGDHDEEKKEEEVGEPAKKGASQCNGGDGDDGSEKDRTTSLLGMRVVDIHRPLEQQVSSVIVKLVIYCGMKEGRKLL